MIRRRPAPRARGRRSLAGKAGSPRGVTVRLVVLVFLVLVAWWLLRSPAPPSLLEPSDPVARLLLEEEETRLAVWSEERLSASFSISTGSSGR